MSIATSQLHRNDMDEPGPTAGLLPLASSQESTLIGDEEATATSETGTRRTGAHVQDDRHQSPVRHLGTPESLRLRAGEKVRRQAVRVGIVGGFGAAAQEGTGEGVG